MSDKVLIWSNEHRAWWRPNSHGYTTVQEEAGLYSEKGATMIIEEADEGFEMIVRPFGEPTTDRPEEPPAGKDLLMSETECLSCRDLSNQMDFIHTEAERTIKDLRDRLRIRIQEIEGLRGPQPHSCSDCGSTLVLCEINIADYVCPRCVLKRARKAEAALKASADEGIQQ